jgi:transcriptional regulator with XRE-family HTH domain
MENNDSDQEIGEQGTKKGAVSQSVGQSATSTSSTSSTLVYPYPYEIFRLKEQEDKSLLEIEKIVGKSNQTISRILNGKRHSRVKLFFDLVSKGEGSAERVLEWEYQEALKSRGYGDHEIDAIIKDMEDGKVIERVSESSGLAVLRLREVKRSAVVSIHLTSIDNFFSNDKLLSGHSIEQSVCYPIIGSKSEGDYTMYYCKIHPKIKNANLGSIEHHCRFSNPDQHKTEMLRVLEQVDGQ